MGTPPSRHRLECLRIQLAPCRASSRGSHSQPRANDPRTAKIDWGLAAPSQQRTTSENLCSRGKDARTRSQRCTHLSTGRYPPRSRAVPCVRSSRGHDGARVRGAPDVCPNGGWSEGIPPCHGTTSGLGAVLRTGELRDDAEIHTAGHRSPRPRGRCDQTLSALAVVQHDFACEFSAVICRFAVCTKTR